MAPRVLLLSVLAVVLGGCRAPQAETAAASSPDEARDQSTTSAPAISEASGGDQRIQSTYSEDFERCWQGSNQSAIRQTCVEREASQQQARLDAADAKGEAVLVGPELEAYRQSRRKLREEIASACTPRPEATEAEQLDAAYCVMFRTAQAAEEREIANDLEQEVRL